MKLSAPRSAAAVLLAMAVVVLVSWWLLSRGAALALAMTSPELALRLHGADAEALVRINESEADPVAKAQRARQVLAQRPLDGRAYRQLAEIEEAAGRARTAAALFRVAVRNTPRDRLAQAWMADDALARGANAEAMERLALLADMDATLWPGLFGYLRQLSLREGAWTVLIDQMASEPPWRSQFLSAWAQERPADFDAVMLALEGRGAIVTAAERELWVQHLLRRQRWTVAYLAWASGLETSRRPRRTGVFNGGFEAPPAGHFDWVIAQGSGSRNDRLATAGADGERALRIQFTGQPGSLPEQMLVLPPGAHVFHARARLDGLRSEAGLVWSVRCVADGALLGSGLALRGSRQWHAYRFGFDVPEGCPAQRLSLEVPAATGLDRRIEGVVWFDEVTVAAAAMEAPRSPAPGAKAADGQAAARAPVPTGHTSAGMPAALVVGAANGATMERQGRTFAAETGALLLAGDRVMAPPGTLALRWRDGCERAVAAATVALASPCPDRPPHEFGLSLEPRAREIVRMSLAKNPGATGSSGADLPVGP